MIKRDQDSNSKISKMCKGFTLLEITVVLLIFGIIVAGLSPLYNLYIKNVAEDTTRSNVENASYRLANFLAVNGRYPCPAPPFVGRDDDNYGRESTECALPSTSKTLVTGTCDNATPNTATSGICIENSQRPSATDEYRIIIGLIPFRQLNMQEKDVIDGYGNQITYAVTERLANRDEYNRADGGIRVIDIMNQPIGIDDPTTPDDESSLGHFILISHGENGYGAYNSNGIKIDCAEASATESENCAEAGGNGIFRVATKSINRNNASEYDDFSVSIQSELPQWRLTGGNTENINVLGNDTDVGMLLGDPWNDTLDEELYVGGIVRARERVRSTELCVYDNESECFNAGKIAGDDPEMECLPGEFLIRLENGEFICRAQVSTNCATGYFVTGVNPDGRPICEPKLPANCPASTVNLCPLVDGPVVIPATLNGDTVTVSSASIPGNPRTQTFTCNNGIFEATGSATGLCECNPGVFNVVSGNDCGTCQTGTFDREYVRECPSGSVTIRSANSTCGCSADAQAGNCRQNVPYSCPTGYVASPAGNPPRYERIFQCSGTTPQGFGPSVKVAGTGDCVCAGAADQRRYKRCNSQRSGFTERAGHNGIPEIRSWNCTRTPPAYDSWRLDSTRTSATNYTLALALHCQCNDTRAPQRFTRSCNDVFGTSTEQYTGVIPYRREWDCAALPPAYGSEMVDSDPVLTDLMTIRSTYCTIVPPVECEWKPNVPGSPPRAEFPGPNLNTSQKRCDCDTQGGSVSVCHKTVGSGSRATVYNECICQAR